MLSVPATKMSSAEIWAESRVPLTKVVGRLPPFHCTSEPDTKPEPFTVNWKAGPSRAALLGEIAAIVGMGLGTGLGAAAEPPPPPPHPVRNHTHRKARHANSKLHGRSAFNTGTTGRLLAQVNGRILASFSLRLVRTHLGWGHSGLTGNPTQATRGATTPCRTLSWVVQRRRVRQM